MMKFKDTWIVYAVFIACCQDILCYESAYDLAELRNMHRSVFREPNDFYGNNQDRFYSRRTPLSAQRRINVRSDFGNGYDNIGNGGSRYRHGDWSEFLAPPRAYNFASRMWNSDLGDAVESLPSVERFHEKDISRFPARSNVRTSSQNNFFRRSRPTNNHFTGNDYFKQSYGGMRRGAVGWQPENRPLEISSFLKSDAQDHDNLNPYPRLRTFETERRYTPSVSRRRPPFYRKNYFRTREATPASGETTFSAEKTDGDFQTAAGGADDSVITEADRFFSSNEDQEEKKSDVAYQDDKKGAISDIASKEQIGETTRFDKNGGNKSTVRVNKTAKKGHTTKGFATHHHKDETGNTTTFFDESSDTGGQDDYQDNENEFGARRTMEVLNGKEDGQFFKALGGRSGKFGSGIKQDKTQGETDVVEKNNRFNKEQAFEKGQDHLDRGFKSETDYLGGGTWASGF